VPHRFASSILVTGLSMAAALVGGTTVTAAATPSRSRILAHFDLASGQTAENLTVAPDGSAIVSFAMANQVAQVSLNGTVRVLAQLPSSGKCDIFPGPATLGVARAHDGTIFVAECSGDANTGIWRIRPGGGRPVQIAELSPAGLPNGMAIDERSGNLYVADSLRGEVWQVPTRGGAPVVWAAGPDLQEVSFAGANGLTVHNDAVWVGNTDNGTIVRIPLRHDGIDDFSVIGPDNTVVAAMVFDSQVLLARPGQQPRVLLTAADGISNPTSVRFHGDTMYVTSAAYFTGSGPNLLITRFR
jgi:streptogramin lyase